MADSRICSIKGCGKPQKTRGWCRAHYHRWRRHGDPLGGRTLVGEPAQYFREIVLPFAGTECLIWPYSRIGGGYGELRQDGRTQRVHRLVCEVLHGPAPTPEHEAAHSCGKGYEGCCNPQHIRWATPTENSADRAIHGTVAHGERHGSVKLSEADVLEIRDLRDQLSRREIAEIFGVTSHQIGYIYRGKSWGWLEK